MKFEVIVETKPEVLDPAGRAIQETLNRLGHKEISQVRVSKRFVIDGTTADNLDEIAKSILANPVSETVKIRELSEG